MQGGGKTPSCIILSIMRYFRLRVRSRNKTCAPLRELVFPKRVIYRMGSVTPTDKITKRQDYLELNTAEACMISGNKILMKERFSHGKISTAPWFMVKYGDIHMKDGKYFSSRVNSALLKWKQIIVKRYNSSGGKGIYLIAKPEDFDTFFRDPNGCNENKNQINKYIFEKYYTYSREYRIHVTKEGYFLADRKMLLDDAQERWHRHENNSIWIGEQNELFDKPTNWDDIVASCVKALKSIGLDIAAFDVKVQNNKHEDPKWIIMESNSAPGLGENSIEIYKNLLTYIING